MVNYNMTLFTDSNNLLGMYSAVNTLTGNVFSYLFLITIFIVILFTTMRNNPPSESFVAASSVLTVVSLMFLLADLINIVWVIGATLIFAASTVKLYFQ